MTYYDLDRLESFLEEGPAVLSERVVDVVRRDIHGVRQRRRLPSWQIGPLRVPLLAAVLTLAAIGVGWVSWQAVQSVGDPPPTDAGWMGPVRSDAGQMPVQPMHPGDETLQRFFAEDPRDAASGRVDIIRVHVTSTFWDRVRWTIEVAEARSTVIDGDGGVISFGLVFDTTGDGVPDYAVEADELETSSASVIDLATGVVVQDVVVDVERSSLAPDVQRRTASFTLSRMTRDDDIRASSPFYAWATATNGDEVMAWDYAADDGWLQAPAITGR